MKNLPHLLVLTILSAFGSVAHAQCEEQIEQATKLLTDQFISDGQVYRALVYDDQLAEFDVTLYGGATYRIAAVTGNREGMLQFSLIDEENHVLFTNSEFENASYWDFKINSTLNCTLEAKLDLEQTKSGCAVILIGFER